MKRSHTVYRALTGTGAVLLFASLSAQAAPKNQREAFIDADRNGNQVLDETELKTFLDHMANLGNSQARKVRMLGLYGVAMRTIDTNGDGVASVAELKAQE
jgi:hypothetical protein